MRCVFWSQFHSDPVLAVNACYEGDVVIICPGLYSITSSISLVDSIEVEGNHMTCHVVDLFETYSQMNCSHF